MGMGTYTHIYLQVYICIMKGFVTSYILKCFIYLWGKIDGFIKMKKENNR